jgi:hypothetical protein
MVGYAIRMPDSLFDNFAGAKDAARYDMAVVPGDEDELPIMDIPEPAPQQEAAAQATLFAVAALAAAAAFAVIGLTTVVIAVAVPNHWLVAVLFTGVFVLVAVGAGLAAVWRLRGRPRGQRLQELGMASRAAAGAVRRRGGARGRRRAG